MNRSFTAACLSVPLCLALVACEDQDAPPPAEATVSPETKTIEQLYQDALAEGGKLTLYAGGDAPDTYSYNEAAFKKRFPGMETTIKVDLSKYHDVVIDEQLAKGELVPDMVYLQTLHTFDRWKSEGHLLRYKPLAWDQIYPEFKDPDGAFVGLEVSAFSNLVNIKKVPETEAPRDALDYLDPRYKGKLVFTYPNDDDAVLFVFKLIIDKHGWEYMDKLMAQEPTFLRGTVPTYNLVAAGDKVATFTVSGSLATSPDSAVKFLLPRTEAFLSWPQTAAIFKNAQHPAAAKLFMSWVLTEAPQRDLAWQWSVRKDTPAPGGYGPVFDYNTSPEAFRAFMRDRESLDAFKAKIEQYVGPVKGPSPLGG